MEVRFGEPPGINGFVGISGVTGDFGTSDEEPTEAVGEIALAYEVPEDGPDCRTSSPGTMISCTMESSISTGDISGGESDEVEEEGPDGKGTADDLVGCTSDHGETKGRGDGGSRVERFDGEGEGEGSISGKELITECEEDEPTFAYETSSSKNCAFLIGIGGCCRD